MKLYKFKIKLLSIALLLFGIGAFAQQENDKWNFGQNQWDFNGVNFTSSQFGYYNKYATASISDKTTGQLLFYSSGLSVSDRNGNLMSNGNELVGPNAAFYDSAAICGGNMTSQGVVILPKPNSPNQYYIFTTVSTRFEDCSYAGNINYNFGVRYAIVDMSSGLGTVTSKNNIIQTEASKGLTPVLASDGTSYWIIVTNAGSFNAYKVDGSGISSSPIVSTVATSSNFYAKNAIKVSPNSEKLLYGYMLYDFNNATGLISNPIDITASAPPFTYYEDQSVHLSSTEFSEDSNIIYFVSALQSGTVGQTIISSGLCMYNIATNQLFGADPNGGYINEFIYPGAAYGANIQRAANGKIYLIFNQQTEDGPFYDQEVDFGYSDYLPPFTYHSYDWGVINNPNVWNTTSNPISYIPAPLGMKNGYVFPQLIPEGPTCIPDLIITANVLSGQTDIQEAGNTIIATNTIFSGGTAEYDAGATIYLKPGFRSNAGSETRLYIEGCTEPKPIGGDGDIKSMNNTVSGLESPMNPSKVLDLFPNPTSGSFSLKSKHEMLDWEITNQVGSIRYTDLTQDANQTEIDISRFATGVYFLKVTFKDGDIVMKTIIKE